MVRDRRSFWLKLLYSCPQCDRYEAGDTMMHLETCPGCGARFPRIDWSTSFAPMRWWLATGKPEAFRVAEKRPSLCTAEST